MKKLITILAFALIITLVAVNNFVLMSASFKGSYTFYNAVSGQERVKETTTNNIWHAQWHNMVSKNLEGKTVTFKGNNENIKDFVRKLNIKTISTQELNGTQIIYGYTARLRGGIMVDGQKINIQIAKNNDIITIGSPIIFGSY